MILESITPTIQGNDTMYVYGFEDGSTVEKSYVLPMYRLGRHLPLVSFPLSSYRFFPTELSALFFIVIIWGSALYRLVAQPHSTGYLIGLIAAAAFCSFTIWYVCTEALAKISTWYMGQRITATIVSVEQETRNNKPAEFYTLQFQNGITVRRRSLAVGRSSAGQEMGFKTHPDSIPYLVNDVALVNYLLLGFYALLLFLGLALYFWLWLR